jgi:hypothetical protein
VNDNENVDDEHFEELEEREDFLDDDDDET